MKEKEPITAVEIAPVVVYRVTLSPAFVPEIPFVVKPEATLGFVPAEEVLSAIVFVLRLLGAAMKYQNFYECCA